MSSGKQTAARLRRLEEIVARLQYKLRYEKGNFRAGYCLVQNQKVVIVNRFYTPEARVECLTELLKNLDADWSLLDAEMRSELGLPEPPEGNT